MKVLVTGAAGFVGKNLCARLKDICEVYEYDRESTIEDIDRYCSDCEFVFNLAGVNRSMDQNDFMQGNFGFASLLLDTLKKHGNSCPVMISSSIQASLSGRFGFTEYGASKRAGEDLMIEYGKDTGAKVLIYRFPNIFGKWCRPNYNSAIATFCHNIARGLPIQVNDRNVELELLYIDDLVDEMIDALRGREHCCDFTGYCYCPVTHKATLGEIVDMLNGFSCFPDSLTVPQMPSGSLAKKLYSTYLSYLPDDRSWFALKMNKDTRGSFTEVIRTRGCGQVSVNVCRPGVTKGQHWHNSKWEIFIVVSGHGLIRQRRIDSGHIMDVEVCGDELKAVYMLPGYTHSIMNLSETEDLVTVMYCNETFDPENPDTYYLKV